MSKTTWTPEIWEQILSVIRAGGTRTAAYKYVGVPEKTYYQWLTSRPELKDDLAQADGHAEVRCSSRIAHAIASGDVQTAKWWLTVRRPDDWAPKVKVDQTVTIEEADPAQTARAKLEQMAKSLEASTEQEKGDDG